MNYGDFSNPNRGYNSANPENGGYNRIEKYDLFLGDDLSELSVLEKRDFYQRLAGNSLDNDPDSLAGVTLNYWLTKLGSKLIVSNTRVKNLVSVNDELLNEYRQVILSQKPAFLNKSRVGIRGVRDRLLGLNGHPKWDKISKIPITYEGPSFELVTVDEFEVIQEKVESNQKLTKSEELKSDIFCSFHESGLSSSVVLSVKEIIPNNKYKISFDSWKSKIIDNYNWDSGILGFYFKLTLLNPDYKNPCNIAKPVAPEKKFITINHSNAKAVENAVLAKSFDFDSEEWDVRQANIIEDYILYI